jgi:hypothetical protein
LREPLERRPRLTARQKAMTGRRPLQKDPGQVFEDTLCPPETVSNPKVTHEIILTGGNPGERRSELPVPLKPVGSRNLLIILSPSSPFIPFIPVEKDAGCFGANCSDAWTSSLAFLRRG